MADKVRRSSDGLFVFHCPGCGCGHFVRVNAAHTNTDGFWGWNGSVEAPTFTPSIIVYGGYPDKRCHSFVRDGKIQFLDDCSHALKGQTVEIPDWDN